jgi:signal transduction histidine kinase
MIITTGIFFLMAYFSYVRLRNLIDYSHSIEQTNSICGSTAKCYNYLIEADNGVRGYLLTGDSKFLSSLTAANKELFSELDRLSALTREYGESVVFINAFKRATIRQISYINRLLINSRPGAQISSRLLETDKQMGDEVKRTYTAMEKNLTRKLVKRQQTKNAFADVTPFFLVLFSFSSILLIFISYIVIIRELKKRSEVQAKLQLNVKALEQSNEELKQFAYIASHDLQEPLRKIQTFGNRLSEKYVESLDDHGKQLIQKIQHSASRMQELISDLLSFSTIIDIEQKKPVAVQLETCLKNAADSLSEQFESKNASFHYDPLPVIQGYPRQIEQLFQNLLSNALKFSRPGVSPEVIVTYQLLDGSQNDAPLRDRPYHKITFRDNGIGFDKAYVNKLFVIFQRLHGKAEYEGTGIGLAICKKIVSNHNGAIYADSELNKGSQFTVLLPA